MPWGGAFSAAPQSGAGQYSAAAAPPVGVHTLPVRRPTSTSSRGALPIFW